MTDISNTEDVLDSRDVIARFEELEAERDAFQGVIDDDDASAEDKEKAAADLHAWNDDEGAEFRGLEAFLASLKGNGGDEQWRGDWYPVTLIRDSYFVEYAQELADDLYGEQMRNSSWPFNCIDWDKAADELLTDYTAFEFEGVTYWAR